MKLRTLLSAALFVSTAAWIAWVATSSAPERTEPPELFYELPESATAEFVLTPDVERVKLVSMVLLTPEEAVADERRYPYSLGVEWVDPSGAVVRQSTYHEQSRVSWFQGPSGEVSRYAVLPGDHRWVTDDRLTYLPARQVLPDGGTLRITPTIRGHDTLVRAFGLDELPALSLERSVLAPSRKQKDLATKHSGIPTWSMLEPAERRDLLRWRWSRLDAKGRERLLARPVLIQHFRLAWDERQVRRLVLEPGRSMAVNLHGPVRIRLSGSPDITRLDIGLVADHAPDDDPPVHRELPEQTLGLPGETYARSLLVDLSVPFSLVLHNPAEVRVPFHLSMDEADPHTLFGATPAAMLSDLLDVSPDEPLERDVALVAPERRILRTWMLAPDLPHPLRLDLSGFGRDDELRLTTRAVLDGPEDDGPRGVTVSWLDRTGRVIRAERLVLDVIPSTFESWERVGSQGALGTDDGWLGEPISLFATGLDGAATLELRAEDPMLVGASAWGFPSGRDDLYPLPHGMVRVRYGREPLTQWHRLEPANVGELQEAEQWASLSAIVRLEPLAEPDTDAERPYTTVDPLSDARRATGQVWLASTGGASHRGTLHCRIQPSEAPVPFVRGRRDDELTAVLWSESEGLGEPWRILLDGHPWRSGRVLQRVTTVRSVREPPHRTARVEAPPGSVLWLATDGASGGCAEPHASWTLYPVAANDRVDFEIVKTLPEQLFLLAAAGPVDGRVEVGIEGHPVPLGQHLTRMVRTLVLPRTQRRAWALMEPGQSTWVLDSVAIRLRPDISLGRRRISVVNRSGRPLFLRAALEGVGPGRTETPRWVYASEVER